MSQIVEVKPSQAITQISAMERACKDLGGTLRQTGTHTTYALRGCEYEIRLRDGGQIGLRQTGDGYVFVGDDMVLRRHREDIGHDGGTLVQRYRYHQLSDDLRERYGWTLTGERTGTDGELVLEFERYGKA